MRLLPVLKAKLIIALLAGVAVVGGGTAVFASTSAGQHTWQAITSAAHATMTPEATEQNHQIQNNSCAGLADAQRLATQFSLSTAGASDAVQAICALHGGTFNGTIPGGSTVSSSRVFGYGEIEQLLTYAQFLASHDQSNQDGKLTTGNARGYLAEALQRCGTTPLEGCLKTHIPGYQPGNGNGNGNGGGNGNGNGNGGGKPTSTPTPHH
jgi:hypothetical protein